jgi:hypothetical protein
MPIRNFDCFVGVDWSGARGSWQKGLKVAVAYPGIAAPLLQQPPDKNDKWSRTSFSHWLEELVQRQRVLVGLDFAFGFPSVEKAICSAELNWEYVERICDADQNFYGGRFFGANTPHSCLINSRWMKGARYLSRRLRVTEFAAACVRGATPQCVFNAIGPAQVGPSSVSGMRFLLDARRKYADRAMIWPFERNDGERSVIVEVFPRYFPLSKNTNPRLANHGNLNWALTLFDSETAVAAPKSEDEGDALLVAAALRYLSKDPKFFDLPDPAIAKEGWIYGVPVELQHLKVDLQSSQIAEIERRLSDDELCQRC